MEIYDLYQRAVQAPEADIEFFEHVYGERTGGLPTRLREDFAGTALLASEWARSHIERRAWAVDIDPEPLAWGREHNLDETEVADRVELLHADVLTAEVPTVDIVCALNFSCCLLKSRVDLGRYFEAAFDNLAPGGLLVLDLYGGTEAIVATSEERQLDGFTYIWEQTSYNPVTQEGRCAIHFELDDGTRLANAFTYDWRLWTIAEIRDLMDEIGFRETLVYWEAVDEDGDGIGEYRLTEEEENQEGWLVYLVGVK
jgi:SAM-dependent methyltransferase